MKKIIPIIVIVVIIVGAGAFFGGMKYAESKTLSRRPSGQMGTFSGLNGGANNNNAQAGFTAGDIIAKDANSVTIKLRDGGSKIVFFSDSTQVTKTVNGDGSDLEVGKSVTVSGSTNSDGSITAKQIQVRPAITQP
jgi:hypothetical protein